MKKKAKEVVRNETPSKIEFETFQEPTSYRIDNLRQTLPSCFNGEIRVKRWKVTIELIDESKELLYERLLDLWERCDNWHHREPLRSKAARLGFELPNDSFGKRREVKE